MYGNVKTMWFAMLQLSKSLNRDHDVVDYSTLNEKLNIQAGSSLAAGEMPDVQYMAIGRGGVVNNGQSDRDMLQHKVTDGCLFEQIPFAMREISNDFDPAERDKYRLRRLETYGGTQYFCYYLLKVDIASSTPELNKIDTSGGVEDISPFVPQPSQLTPTPVPLDATGLPISTSNVSISVAAPVEITLSSQDIQNITEACRIIYGSVTKAIISEVAFCSGFDKTVTSNDGGTTVNYTEAIACQPATFIGEDLNLLYTSNSYTFRYELGTTLRLIT